MASIHSCSLHNYLKIVPATVSDYKHLSRFHYQSTRLGPIRAVYKLIDDHPWRRLAAPLVGVIVYGSPPANLAGRNAATGGVFAGMDRASALSLLNERIVCIRRVIIEPRYRGLGLARRLVAETMPLTGAAMVETVSVMGRVHPFFTRAGMKAFAPTPEAKTERMAAALEAVGIGEGLWHDGLAAHSMIETLCRQSQGFIIEQMDGFCQKFTNQRQMPHSPQRTGFVLSKLAARGAYYLWENKIVRQTPTSFA